MKSWDDIHRGFNQAVGQSLDLVFEGQPSVVINADDFSSDDAAAEAQSAIEIVPGIVTPAVRNLFQLALESAQDFLLGCRAGQHKTIY